MTVPPQLESDVFANAWPDTGAASRRSRWYVERSLAKRLQGGADGSVPTWPSQIIMIRSFQTRDSQHSGWHVHSHLFFVLQKHTGSTIASSRSEHHEMID